MATQKELFVIDLLETAQNAAKQVMDKVESIDSQYFDSGYNSGGSNPIVDDDLNGVNPGTTGFNGITAAQVASVITAYQQLNNFFQNSAVATADYSVTFNTVRNAKFG